MPPELSDEIRSWLIKAAHDLEAANRLNSGEDPLRDVVVYHCQQAAEKALKAYLTWRECPFEKTHALVTLVEQAIPFDNGFSGLRDDAEDLTPLAVRFRYPGDVLDPDKDVTEDALVKARRIVEFIKKALPPEALSK